MIHHAWGIVQLKQQFSLENPVICVPSGNFGNLVSAIYAERCGMKVKHFIAATNTNAIFSSYLQTGKVTPQISIPTYSTL